MLKIKYKIELIDTTKDTDKTYIDDKYNFRKIVKCRRDNDYDKK